MKIITIEGKQYTKKLVGQGPANVFYEGAWWSEFGIKSTLIIPIKDKYYIAKCGNSILEYIIKFREFGNAGIILSNLWALKNSKTNKYNIYTNSGGFGKIIREATPEEIELLEPKKELFTTDDGVKIYNGDKCWFIDLDESADHEISWVKIFEKSTVLYETNKYFSTEEKAQEYIWKNKPCLSYNDFIKYSYGNVDGNIFVNLKTIEKLIKSKD